MEIKILGTGCPKCKTLEKVTRDALAESGIEATVEKVEDIVKIMQYNVMHTPGLVIDGKVVLSGQVPSLLKVKEILLHESLIQKS
jgi:small redox-active disulfide protein 2